MKLLDSIKKGLKGFIGALTLLSLKYFRSVFWNRKVRNSIPLERRTLGYLKGISVPYLEFTLDQTRLQPTILLRTSQS